MSTVHTNFEKTQEVTEFTVGSIYKRSESGSDDYYLAVELIMCEDNPNTFALIDLTHGESFTEPVEIENIDEAFGGMKDEFRVIVPKTEVIISH